MQGETGIGCWYARAGVNVLKGLDGVYTGQTRKLVVEMKDVMVGDGDYDIVGCVVFASGKVVNDRRTC